MFSEISIGASFLSDDEVMYELIDSHKLSKNTFNELGKKIEKTAPIKRTAYTRKKLKAEIRIKTIPDFAIENSFKRIRLKQIPVATIPKTCKTASKLLGGRR
jgi:ribonuclease HII